MKNVYVCYGNHDGVIGVYTNKILAYEKAKEYVVQPGLSYSQLCKEMKNYNKCEVEIFGASGDDICVIMKEILNDKY
tara:strand:- start:185 stop:415 length:231 start_codon:yes stop_codon:yes gene_type:complete